MDEYEKLAEDRMNICKSCPLYLDNDGTIICNPHLYLDMADKKTVYDHSRIGAKKGCGCLLNKRVHIPYAHCICEKW